MALIAGEAESLARRPVDLGVALRIERFLRVLAQVGDQNARLLLGRRLHAGHHVAHQRAEIAAACHAQHHALDDAGPFRRVMHRRVRQVVALHAVAHGELRAARLALRQLARVVGRRQDALEQRPVRALRPAFLGLFDLIGRGGGAKKHGEQRQPIHAAQCT